MPCTDRAYPAAPIDPYIPAAIAGGGPDFVEAVPRLSLDPAFY